MRLFAIMLSFISTVALTAQAKTTEDHSTQKIYAATDTVIKILPYDFFLNLPKAQQAKYIKELRLFLVAQESKQEQNGYSSYRKETSNFSMMQLFVPRESWAADDDELPYTPGSPDATGRCHEVPDIKIKLAPGVASIITDRRDQCIIAGAQYCMAITKSGRLSCRTSDMNSVSKEWQCSEEKPKDLKCRGLFAIGLQEDICVPGGVGSTKRCNEKAPSPEQVAAAIRNDPEDWRKSWIEESARLRWYCGTKSRTHSFDVNDCEALMARLEAIEKALPEEKADALVATCTLPQRDTFPVTKSPLRFQITQHGSKGYGVKIIGKELRNWASIGETLTTDSIESRFPGGWETISRFVEDQHETEISEEIRFAFEEKEIKKDCSNALYYVQTYRGKLADGQCTIKIPSSEKAKDYKEIKIAEKSKSTADRFYDSEDIAWKPDEFKDLPVPNGLKAENRFKIESDGFKLDKNHRCSIKASYRLASVPAPENKPATTGKGEESGKQDVKK